MPTTAVRSQASAAATGPLGVRTAVEGHGQVGANSRPDLLLLALALMIWTYVWRIQDLLPVLGALKISLLSAALSIGLFALDRHPARALVHLKMPILICALALLGVAALGIPMSLWPRRSATFLVTDFVPNLLFMVVLAASVRGIRDLEWLALVSLAGACVHSLFAEVNFEVQQGDRLNELMYYDSNDLALVLVSTLPFAIFFLARRGWWYRILGACSLIVIVATIAKSGSRGGFLGLVAVLAYVLISYRTIPTRLRLLAVAGGFALLSLAASDAYWERIRSLRNPQEDYNWSGRSTEGRMEVWKRGLQYIGRHPVFGVGMRNFAMAEGRLSEEGRARAERGAGFKWSVAHNSFIEIGAELGLIGLALFVGLFIFALRALRRIRAAREPTTRATIRDVAFASTLTASLVGFIVCGFFVSAWYFSFLYMVLALVLGFAKLDRLNARPLVVPADRLGVMSPRATLASPSTRRARAEALVELRQQQSRRRFAPRLPRED